MLCGYYSETKKSKKIKSLTMDKPNIGPFLTIFLQTQEEFFEFAPDFLQEPSSNT